MGNRTARHQRPGQKNLRGRKTASFCPCCDDVINHREKVLAELARQEMGEETADQVAVEIVDCPVTTFSV